MAQTRVRTSIDDGPRVPWWRVPMVWLVIGGPALVVVAAIATAVIAIRTADTLVTDQTPVNFSERPALEGRNHAATPQEGR